jgi:hypothetical protein
MVRPAAFGMALALLAACTPGAPRIDPDRPRPPRVRLLRTDLERLWTATLETLEELGVAASRSDRAEGRIETTAQRRLLRGGPAGREDLRELQRIADLEPARRLGMEGISEYSVEYELRLSAVDERSCRIEASARIWAVDRSEVIVLGPGLYSVVPRRFELASRGVAERELVGAIAERLFTGEEALYFLDQLGRD